MWKIYSKSYLNNNRASAVSIMAAAFIAAMFLSLLISYAYNFWWYETEKIILEEGDWQGRITGEMGEKDLLTIQNFATVEKIVLQEPLPETGEAVVDIYLQNARAIYQDLPRIAAQLEDQNVSLQYNSLLLSRYLIHDPRDETPPMVLTLYLVILLMAVVSLVLVIRNSFELSMNARIHQFGILSSIGATPKQLLIGLLQEALVLSAVPVILGSLLGAAFSRGLLAAINFYARDLPGRREAVFQYRPALYAITVVVSFLTVLFSAWFPARKLSRWTPLEAIRNTGGLQLKKRKHSPLLSVLFGVEGELAGNALKAQKRSLRLAAISLLLSFLGFSIMLCFTTLSGISTRYTYFERYQDVWDIMVTVKDTPLSDVSTITGLKTADSARDVAIYQKAETVGILEENQQSDELLALGGLGDFTGAPKTDGRFEMEVPIIVLDDASFLVYCSQVGAAPGLDGAVVLNRIWDSKNSNFRYREYVPFVKESGTTHLRHTGQVGRGIELPVLSYTQTAPVLREEYADYALVHIVPLSLWEELSGAITSLDSDSYIRILSKGDGSLAVLDALEKETVRLLGERYEVESENRIQERIVNDRMNFGMKMILGVFCVLLALIGITNVFSYTLGFLRQRKREFAQYMSVGLTPAKMRKIFFIEALVIAGRPLLITFFFTILFVQFATTASYLEPMVFWREAPFLPIFLFAAGIIFFVALAYYIGGKRILRCNLNEVLWNDTLS